MQDDGSLRLDNPAAPAKPELSWRERRWERRRKRRMAEEILGWILVPVIVAGCYGLLVAVLGALGTSPSAVIQAFGQLRGP
jgi:hypothetical protein